MDKIIKISNNKLLDKDIQWADIAIRDIPCENCKCVLFVLSDFLIQNEYICCVCRHCYKLI